jgi:hypothetical protein
MISTRPFLKTPTHEYVVPRSIPMQVLIFSGSSCAEAIKGEANKATVAYKKGKDMVRHALNLVLASLRKTETLTSGKNESSKDHLVLFDSMVWVQSFVSTCSNNGFTNECALLMTSLERDLKGLWRKRK